MNTQNQRQPKGWGKLFAALALFVVVFLIQIVIAAVYMLFTYVFGAVVGDNFVSVPILRMDLPLLAICEFVSGVCALLFVWALGTKTQVKFPPINMRFALKAAAAFLIVDFCLFLLSTVGSILTEEVVVQNGWPGRIALLLVLCLGIGMYEEGAFRGLILHGLLARMGTNKKGMFGAVLLSSLIFGLAHVIPVSFSDNIALDIAQMLLKTLQAGMIGIIFAVIVIKTRNLWGVIILHAANDFVLLLFETGIWGRPFETEYVAAGQDGVALVIMYSIVCIAYLPGVIYCLKQLHTLQPPYRGEFMIAATVHNAPIAPAAAVNAAPQTPVANTSWTGSVATSLPIAPQGYNAATPTQQSAEDTPLHTN